MDYPEAYAVFCDESGVAEWDCDVMFSRKTDADCHLESLVEATDEEDEQRPGITDMSRWHVVQLLPAPVVERMIAEAEQRGHDAERERCRKIAAEIEADAQPRGTNTDDEESYGRRSAAERIGALISSGIEPGKGAE